jgi:hypothetical protein
VVYVPVRTDKLQQSKSRAASKERSHDSNESLVVSIDVKEPVHQAHRHLRTYYKGAAEILTNQTSTKYRNSRVAEMLRIKLVKQEKQVSMQGQNAD